MNILAVDFGKKRIGLATGDTETRMAFPLRSVDGTDRAAAIAEIVSIAKAENATQLVVGIPKPLAKADGIERKNVEADARAFAMELRAAAAPLIVDEEDERFSSRMADRWRELSETKKDKFDRDAHAAAAILESYLVRLANGSL